MRRRCLIAPRTTSFTASPPTSSKWTLEKRNGDHGDFKELPVWSIRAAFKAGEDAMPAFANEFWTSKQHATKVR